MVLLLQREYSLTDPRVRRITAKGIKPRWPQLLACAHFDWRTDRMLPRAAEACKRPAILFMLFLCVYSLGIRVYLERHLDSSQTQLLALKAQNRELSLDIEETLSERDFWQGIHDKITSTPDFYNVIAGIAKAAQLSNSQIVSINYRGEEVRVSAMAQGDENDLVNRLLGNKVFREVHLISSRQNPANSRAKNIEIRLLLKRRSELTPNLVGGVS
jgi:hypothetical protein